MRRILVTGGAGFIGSNFIRYMLETDTAAWVINLDALTYAGNLNNLRGVDTNPRYTFVRGDIRDAALLDDVFKSCGIDTVVNFAAESHVDRSVGCPSQFVETNVMGAQRLLDAAKNHWARDLGFKSGVRFLQVSTDEVYGTLGPSGKFSETSPLMPNNPYAASKAAADLFTRAYHATYGLPVVITRCSNNYGPYQFPEKLIPLMIRGCRRGEPLPVYGDGLHIRDWLHVSDHCSAIRAVLARGRAGEVYNIGGNNEKSNIDIVRLIIKALGRSENLIRHVSDRPGHDRRYAVDNTKITGELGWKPSCRFERGIDETIRWYEDNADWLDGVITGVYAEYYDTMYKGR